MKAALLLSFSGTLFIAAEKSAFIEEGKQHLENLKASAGKNALQFLSAAAEIQVHAVVFAHSSLDFTFNLNVAKFSL